MTFIDDLRPDLDAIRAGVPGEMGLRAQTLTVRVTTWPGASRPGYPASVAAITADTAITNADGFNYKIVPISTKDIALSGGKYQAGQFKVGPITPTYTGGVVSFGALDPAVSTTTPTEVRYVIVDPLAGTTICKKVELDSINQLHWYLVLEPAGHTP